MKIYQFEKDFIIKKRLIRNFLMKLLMML